LEHLLAVYAAMNEVLNLNYFFNNWIIFS
jgi:hypothetical protein